MEYLDFDLEVGPGNGQAYPMTLRRSPVGQARATMHFPFAPPALEALLKEVELAVLRSSKVRRRVAAPQEQVVQQFGQQLFEALLAGEIGQRYRASVLQATPRGRGLRLRLRLLAPELAALPWEYLYDANQGEYLCLARVTPLVRDLAAPLASQPFPVQPPLRILGMVASPSDQVPLKIEAEQARLEMALQRAIWQGSVYLKWMRGQTWRDLQREMRGGPWHIFHFIGHGAYNPTGEEGLLALAGEDGKTALLGSAEAGRLLASHLSLRLIVLNACEGARGSTRDLFSSMATTLARRGAPAVLAMQEELSDEAAIELTRTFYEVLAEGRPVDEAISEARTAISLSLRHTLEWGTPVLYLRTPDGMLFDLPLVSPTTTLHQPQPVPQPQPVQPQPQPVVPPQQRPPVIPPPQQKPLVTPQKVPPAQPQPGKPSRTWRVSLTIMGVLRALAGAGVGVLAGENINRAFDFYSVAGALLGGALGIVVTRLEESARLAQNKRAQLLMRGARLLFGGALGALLGASALSNEQKIGALLGAVIGGAVVFLFGWIERRANATNNRALLNVVRTARTLTKGLTGALGGAALAFALAAAYLLLHPVTASDGSDPIGAAIGAIVGGLVLALLLGLLVALLGLIAGLVAGAIIEFSAPPPAKTP
jgi:CHAT domain-containing protein